MSAPGSLGPLVRAALPAVPGLNRLPGLRKAPVSEFTGLSRTREAVTVERHHVERYAEVCGFARRDTVPLPYPHVLAFGLHLAIMADPAFPYPAPGTVHLENSITGHRPIGVGEVLDLVTSVGPSRPHRSGTLLDFDTRVSVGGELVWESTSRYLRRGARPEGEPYPGLGLPEPPAGGAPWGLPADLGRRYARVSGDHNPIHLHPLTARAWGYRRPIAHGMWTKARCLAAIENRLPDPVRVEVAFGRPVPLPGTVLFAHRAEPGGDHTFGLTRPGDGARHLSGRASRP